MKKNIFRTVFSWTIFPSILIASHWAAIYGMQQGHSPAIVTAVIIVVSTFIILITEQVHYHAFYWKKSQGDVATDFMHAFFSQLLPVELFNGLCHSTLLVGAIWVSQTIGFSMWPHSWPLVVQLAFALVISEFGHYWWHRLCHETNFFWRFHATHHSPGRLYWLNAARFHPIDIIVSYALQAIPLILMGASKEVLALFTLFTAVHGLFQHANIELKLGPLNYIFSMAELHRWHHSRNIQDANANYGANLIIWDIIFGTRYLPKNKKHQPEDVGFDGMPNFPKDYFGQIASPFVWQKLKSKLDVH